MRRLGRTLRQRQPSQAKTIAQKVAAILRKYGTDAHVYLPGIGVINGLTAGNYLDSAGTTAATVDNPVGLVVDSGGINAIQATTANKPILRYASGKYYWSFDSTDALTATFPAGYESATIINTAETGQVTYTNQNIVGSYDMRGAVIGSELVTNGDFTTDSAWTKGTGWTISGGTANFNNPTGTTLIQTIPSVAAGKLLIMEFYLNAVSGNGLTVGVNIGGGIDSFGTFNGTGKKSAVVTTTVARSGLSITGIGSSVFSIDNLSIREATPKEYARFIFRTGLTASELATMQTFANRLAGV